MSSTAARRIIRWIGKALLWLVVVLLVLAVIGAIYQAVATERAERAYPPPGEGTTLRVTSSLLYVPKGNLHGHKNV